MYIVNSYTLAIIFCFITMICWDRGKYLKNWPVRIGVMNFIIGTTPSASCCSPYFWYSH